MDSIDPYWYASAPLPVTASAPDPDTANVTLWSRFSSDGAAWDPWTAFGTLYLTPWSWTFPFPDGEGHYEFYSAAVDAMGNAEPPPPEADARAGYDATPPASAVLPIAPYWHPSQDLVVNATATDALSGVADVTLWYAYAPDNLTWSPWSAYGTRTSRPWSWSFPFPDGEGNYRFHTIARDVAGNVEGNKTAAEAIAGYRVPPDYAPANPRPSSPTTVGLSRPVTFSVEITNPGGNANATATLAFFNASTPGVPFATFTVPPIPAGGTAGPFAAPWTSPAVPGTSAVSVSVDYGNDVAESNESNDAYTWTVVAVPGPVTSLVVGAPNVTAGATYVTSATPLSFSVLDQSGTGIRNTTYRVDGGPWVNYTATGPFTLAAEGAHRVAWSSEDFAGNVEPVVNATLRVDDSPPTTVLSIGAPKYVAANTFVTSATLLVQQATDGGVTPVGVASTEYRIDGGAWAPYASPFKLVGEGRHTVDYRSSDRLGNAESLRTLALMVDDTPPTTALVVGEPKSLVGGTFVNASTPLTPAATDTGATPVGLVSSSFRVWSGTWTAWAPYASFTLSGPDGVRYVEYRSTDLLGNLEAVRNETLVLDDTSPTTTLSASSGPYTTATTFTLSATDAGSGVNGTEIRIHGGTWTPYAGAFTLAAGDHTVSYRSVDRLGNREPEGTRAIHVEGTPPPAVEANLKPLVAAVFAAILALVGAWSSRRAPLPTGSRRRLRAFLLAALPFVAAEIATGVVSLVTGLLVIPPLLGVGTVVDLAILIAGIAVAAYRARKWQPPT